MDCKRFEKLLPELLLEPDDHPRAAHLAEHVAACASCRQAQASLQQSLSGLVRPSGDDRISDKALIQRLQCAVLAEIAAVRFRAPRPRFRRPFADRPRETFSHTHTFGRRGCSGRLQSHRLGGTLAFGLLLIFAGEFAWRQWESHRVEGIEDTASAAPLMGQLQADWRASVAPEELVTDDLGQRIFGLISSREGRRVVAFDAGTGRHLWASAPMGMVHSRLFVQTTGDAATGQEASVILAVQKGRRQGIVALSAGEGKPLWEADVARENGYLKVTAAALALLEEGVAWSGTETVALYDYADGQVLWRRAFPEEGPLSGPLPAPGSTSGEVEPLLILSTTRRLLALRPSDGSLVWEATLDRTRGRPPLRRPVLAVAAQRLFLSLPHGPTENLLSGRRLEDGAPLWSVTTGPARDLLADEGRIYLRARGVEAFDARSGKSLWTFAADGCSPLRATPGRLYFSDNKGGTLALDTRTGRQVWNAPEGYSCGVPALSGCFAYLSTRDGRLLALNLGLSG